MKIHNDLSGKCFNEYLGRDIDVPRRLHISGRLGKVIIGDRTQAWLPVLGVMPLKWYWWWFIVYEPSNPKKGLLAKRHPEWYGLKNV